MIRKYAMTICVALFAFLGGLAVNHDAVTEAQGMNRVFELRTYTTNEGTLQGHLDRFGGGETDLFEKHGMHGIGYWVPAESPLSKTPLCICWRMRAVMQRGRLGGRSALTPTGPVCGMPRKSTAAW